MSIRNIIYTIEKSSLSEEEKKECIAEMQKLTTDTKKAVLRNITLIHASMKVNGKRRTKKMLDMAKTMEKAASVPVKISFKKFDIDEMKNPLIKTGVIKNIIGTAHGFNNFINWEFLHGCLDVFERSNYNKDLSGMISFMSDIYDKTSSDAINDTDEVSAYFNKNEIALPQLKPFLGLPKDKRKERVLDVLNKLKEYNNTGEDYYTAFCESP